MRCFMNPGHAALAGMLAGLLSLPAVLAAEENEAEKSPEPAAAAADDELPQYSVPRVLHGVSAGTVEGTVVIEPELELERSMRDKTKIRENTIRLTQWLERTVRAYPEQWNWMNIRSWDVKPTEPRGEHHGTRE